MIKIAELVTEIITGDEIAIEALKAGVLNLSAYAKIIQPQINARLYKSVKLGSIVTSLSRLSPQLASMPELKPTIHIDDMNITSPLCEITYEKTASSNKSIIKLRAETLTEDTFLTVTQGVHEFTIICPVKKKDEVLACFEDSPKGFYGDLTAITVRFNEQEYIEVPNTIFSLVSALATKRINLIEIVSTFSEISFIVRSKDIQETVLSLQQFMHT